ncbi:MAG: ATP-grasp fold amidoligase family protein [Bacteroidota bacterium]
MSPLQILWPFARLFTKKFFNRLLPDRLQLHLTHAGYTGRILNLRHPVRFSEKMEAIKLSPLVGRQQTLTDKLEVRTFVAERIGEQHLIPVYRTFEQPEDITRELLPESFVMKCTHDSGSVAICKDLRTFDVNNMIRELRRSYNRDYYRMHREYNYRGIPPRILCEQFLAEPDGKPPKDYKFFCFNGEPLFLQVDVDRFGSHDRVIYDPAWNKLPFNIKFPVSEKTIERPENLDQMLDIARKLSAGFPFLRVDLYSSRGNTWFGELTFCHGAGHELFIPDRYDIEYGQMIDLRQYFKE